MSRKQLEQHLALVNEKLKRESESSLHTFLKKIAWSVLEPNTPFQDNWHIHDICYYLEAVKSGEVKRLIINMPFRMLKSTIISQAYPAWEWTTSPHLRYLTASYSKELATRDAVVSRKVIESNLYRELWGDVFQMADDQNLKTRYMNNRSGARTVTSTDAAGTGYGGNRIIIDDPISAQQANHPNELQVAKEWYKGTATTRLDNAARDAIIITHQRLKAEDLTGHIMESEDPDMWHHLVLPMRYSKKTITWGKKLRVDPRTIEGELLFPARLDESTVKGMERSLGKDNAQAQLQQDPSSTQSRCFDKKYWNYYFVHPKYLWTSMDEIVWSWDCAFKDKADSDHVSGMAIGRKGIDYYLLHRINRQMTFSQTAMAVRNSQPMFDKLTIATLVEDKANGTAVVDVLKKSVAGLIAIDPQGGKVARANACSPQHQAGNFYLPSPTLGEDFAWVVEFVDDGHKFPNIKLDDDIDSFTQAINWFRSRVGFEAKSQPPHAGGGTMTMGGNAIMGGMGTIF